MAGQLNLYTNNSTGLHINVSIPDKLDVLKLAVFTGDQYVLQQFGRQNSDYAVSSQQAIAGRVAGGAAALKTKQQKHQVWWDNQKHKLPWMLNHCNESHRLPQVITPHQSATTANTSVSVMLAAITCKITPVFSMWWDVLFVP